MIKKIILGSSGGPATEGVFNSLNETNDSEEIVGIGSNINDLLTSNIPKKYLFPPASSEKYIDTLNKLIIEENPSFLHFQNDFELFEISKNRTKIYNFENLFFIPKHEEFVDCVYKYNSYLKFKSADIKVPRNILINDEADLKLSFKELGWNNSDIWFRLNTVGGGGQGSLKTNDYEFIKSWINHHKGWGKFLAAELLTPQTVTWQSIWHDGKLIISQARKRQSWVHGNRAPSGITGVTGVGELFSDEELDKICIKSVNAVSSRPHGLYGVDLAYDSEGIPNPTEINIGRFFTTIEFFTSLGLNFPAIYKNIFLYNQFPDLENKFSPLENNYLWIRNMDTRPKLVKKSELNSTDYEKYIF